MDSVGVGELPDAAAYGDQGSNTVGNIAKRVPLKVPTLRSLGIYWILRGDDNNNAAVRLDYRKSGEQAHSNQIGFPRLVP